MAELFLNIFWASLSGSVIVLLILLLRLFFKRAPKALICVLWLVAILRFLLPVRLEAAWSLQPQRTALADRSQTYMVSAQELAQSAQDIPYQMPVLRSQGLKPERIAGIVWLVGTGCMLTYALISYLRLKHRIRAAQWIDHGIYCCPGLDTAFILGYFNPKIYLPSLEDRTAKLVLQHELAHISRRDNWLMLAGYLSLCLHWFNPLVWLAYVLLCRDIEAACDERVIRQLGDGEKKEYANALLACEKRRSFPVSCPVAFGEISIKQRILRVLNYRRPALWICIVLAVCIVLVAVFFFVEPIQKHPPYYDELIDSLGQPLTQVCDKLRIEQGELVEDGRNTFVTPLVVEYAGIPLQLLLQTGAVSDGDLSGFTYYAVYEGDSDEGDRAALTLCHHLLKAYGPSLIGALQGVTQEDITKTLNGGPDTSRGGRIMEFWDITQTAGGRMEEYLKELGDSERWQSTSVYDGAESATAFYGLTFKASFDKEQGRKYVMLTYHSGGEYHGDWENETS